MLTFNVHALNIPVREGTSAYGDLFEFELRSFKQAAREGIYQQSEKQE